jgi:hypothetical protein
MSGRFSSAVASIEPYLFQAVVALMLFAAGAFGFKYLAPSPASTLGGERVVVFDVVKLANAQRRVASTFLGRDAAAAGEQAALLLDIQERTHSVIRQVAGPGTIVLVKQAVIHTELDDITDAVLKQLKLPTDVPTQDPSNSGIDFAPTILGMTPPPRSMAEKRATDNPLSPRGPILP